MSDRWYYSNDSNEVIGPVTATGLKALIGGGEISRETLICREGTESWIPFSEVFAAPLPPRSVPAAVVLAAAAPTYTPATKPTANAGVAKGCAGCLLVGVGFIVVCLIIGALSDHSTPSNSSSTSSSSTTSAAWNIGYRDGQTAGRADARMRSAKMGYGTRHSEATRHSAPLAPTGLSREEYEDGWSIGYSSGYDSYSK